jgi:hypothetical protein
MKNMYRKQVQLMKIFYWAAIFINFMFVSYIWHDKLTGDYPRLILKERLPDSLDPNQIRLTTYGLYQSDNSIQAIVKYGDTEDTIYHEYGHYIYFKKLTRSERKEWDTVYCPMMDDYPAYMPDEQCSEKFAEAFKYYIKTKGKYQEYIEMYFTSPELYKYIETAYKKWISS